MNNNRKKKSECKELNANVRYDVHGNVSVSLLVLLSFFLFVLFVSYPNPTLLACCLFERFVYFGFGCEGPTRSLLSAAPKRSDYHFFGASGLFCKEETDIEIVMLKWCIAKKFLRHANLKH